MQGKTHFLVRKLDTIKHECFSNFILPKQLSEIFGEQLSLFNVQYNCLKLSKCNASIMLLLQVSSIGDAKNFNCNHWLNALFLLPGCRYSHSTNVKVWKGKRSCESSHYHVSNLTLWWFSRQQSHLLLAVSRQKKEHQLNLKRGLQHHVGHVVTLFTFLSLHPLFLKMSDILPMQTQCGVLLHVPKAFSTQKSVQNLHRKSYCKYSHTNPVFLS